jgi:hypothetical protein
VAALAEAHRAIKRLKAKMERIAFFSFNLLRALM